MMAENDEKWDRLAQVAHRIAELQAEIDQDQALIDSLKGEILGAWEPGRYDADGVSVQVRAGSRRLDAKAFAAKYPASAYPQCYKVVPDPKAARSALGTLAVDPLMIAGTPNVVVR